MSLKALCRQPIRRILRAQMSSTTSGDPPSDDIDTSSKHTDDQKNKKDDKLKGFAFMFDKFDQKVATTEEKTPEDTESFATMFRKSKFVQMGDPTGSVVEGKIVMATDEDLYIDLKSKFLAVCRVPKVKSEKYQIGATVVLRIKRFELFGNFLGADKTTSMRETDAVILGILREAKPYQHTVPDYH